MAGDGTMSKPGLSSGPARDDQGRGARFGYQLLDFTQGRTTPKLLAMINAAADRRPIAARRLRLTAAMAEWLIRCEASPNAISVAGMLAAIAAGFALAAAPEHRLLWLLGAVLVQVRLLANMLDGMVAIGRGSASRLGEVFNEVPDRIADTAVLAGLGIAAAQPWLGLAAALAAMATAYIRAVGKSLGAGSDFCGPGAKQHRMAIVTVAALWCCIVSGLWAAPVPRGALWLILLLATLTAARRLHRLCRVLRQ